jgi:hypothetical protein
MSKVPFYVKRQNGQNSYNYNHPAYNYPYKKNYFKNKNKQSNNHINNYIEERKKNYYYYENPYSYYSFSQKNNYTQWNNPYYPEEKKIEESVGNNSFHEEMKKDELLRIRVNVSEKQYKELVICKKDDVNKKVIEFCKENFITEKLIEPLLNKVNQSLNTLKIINNNYSLNENDFVILNKLRNIISSNKKK